MVEDAGVSDVIATVMLLGVTVAIVAVAALQVTGISAQPAQIHLDTLLIARSGNDVVTLLHAGGSTLVPSELRVQVFVNGAVWFDGSAGPSTTPWAVGDLIDVGPFASMLPPDARVTVTVSHRLAGQVLAETAAFASSTVPVALPAAPGFTVGLKVAGDADSVVIEPPAGLLVEAAVQHPQGRKFVRFVYADFAGFDGVDWQELRDEGANGDQLAGDGIYSTVALVPVNSTSGQATVTVTAVDFQGRRVSDDASVTILMRREVTEGSANPTGTPAPGSTCPSGNAAIAGMEFELNGQFLVPTLAGHVRQGDHVKALVTVAQGCTGIGVSLVSYTASGPVFSWEGARDAQVHQSQTITADAGQLVLELDVPNCYFMVDLVRGGVITTFGPPNDYYSRQGRLLDADNGGTTTCVG